MGTMIFNAIFENAYAHRLGFFSKLEKTDSFRFFSGEGEKVPGLVIDIYNKVAVFQVHEGKCFLSLSELQMIAAWCTDKLKLKSVYLKRFVTDRSHAKKDLSLKSSIPFWGEASEPELIIRENGISYLIRPYDGYSVGIFLDQRKNRAFLAALKKEKVLNCFSYTCAFSVACALQGAEVTSVDVSKKYLEWGKKNFQINKLDSQKHRFILADTIDYLRRAKKKDQVFDLIILDPPSFGRSEKGVFSIKKDIKYLIQSAVGILAPQGVLFFSTNYSEWDTSLIRTLVGTITGLESGFREVKTPKVSEDFQWETNPLSQVCFKKN